MPNSTTLRPAGRIHHARGLAGNQGLEGDGGEQVRLGDLRLHQRRADGEHRLAGKHRRAFGHGEQVAREAKFAEVVEEAGRDLPELRQPAQVVDLLRR